MVPQKLSGVTLENSVSIPRNAVLAMVVSCTVRPNGNVPITLALDYSAWLSDNCWEWCLGCVAIACRTPTPNELILEVSINLNKSKYTEKDKYLFYALFYIERLVLLFQIKYFIDEFHNRGKNFHDFRSNFDFLKTNYKIQIYAYILLRSIYSGRNTSYSDKFFEQNNAN